MSQEPQGPGWWMASDGRWYPPDLHPAVLSGEMTVEEMRSVPLSQRADRTSIRWVAESSADAGPGHPTVAAAPTPGPPTPAAAHHPPAQPPGPPPAWTTDASAGREPEPAPPGRHEPPVEPAAAPPPWIARSEEIDLRAATTAPAEPAAPPVIARVRANVVGADTDPDYELPPERPSRFLLLGVALAALALIAISAFTFLRNRDDDAADDSASLAAEEGSVPAGAPGSVGDLAVGDCLDDPDLAAGDLSGMTLVGCSLPHTHEVYLRTDYEPVDDPFDLARIEAFASDACEAGFESFIGVPFVRSRFHFLALGPTRDSWAEGDRAIACLVLDQSGRVTGTLEGAAS